ncbi:MAG: hypothetical protein DRP99_04840 [Candidatus Latescibacterota bacterium]|nr:MAG: hypothetical protein DRP99_04840 [Candidatus Latescibacterota bacterium]
MLSSICSAISLLALADSLYSCGNYYEAITEYRRYLFFDPSGSGAGYAWYRIGLSYREMGEFGRALEAFKEARMYAATEDERERYRIEEALVLMAQGRWEPAQVSLLHVATFCRDPALRRRARCLLGVSYLYRFNWEEAERCLSSCLSPGDPRLERIRVLLGKGRTLELKSPKKAKLLSTFLPGLGQIYAGDWGAGLNALALNCLTSYLWGRSLLKGRYLDAAFWFTSLFLRYYRGNRFRAEKLAEERNLKVQRKLAEEILEILGR